MRCPYCGEPESKVLDSRPAEERIRRRRECFNCLKRFTTYEEVEHTPLIVIKKDKSRQVFDRQKLLNSFLKACSKRAVPLAVLEKAADDIENTLRNSMENEITYTQIGELVMDKLRDIDDVAYVRFASVYRQFKDINSFMDELNKLVKANPGDNGYNI